MQNSKLHSDESGFALLLTVFIVAIVTILVMDYADEVFAFQRSSRAYTEQIQAKLMLKSAVNLSKLLLEAPKPEDTKDQDWLYEAWNNIGSVPSIPLEGLVGELRVMIVDEDGKLDLNSLQALPGSITPPPGQAGVGTNPLGGAGQPTDAGSYWRNAMKELFTYEGFQKEQYPANSFRTLGSAGYGPSDQVAIISDWIDADSEPFHVPTFDGDGIEGSANKGWFFNRSFKTLSELANVPGMTLERVQQIAPFVRASQSGATGNTAININTAPLEVLLAMGFPQTQAEEIVQQRLSFPYTKEILPTLTAGDPNLASKLKVKSSEFSVYTRVIMPTRTFWAKAIIGVQQIGQNKRRAVMRSIEYY